ncbi:hypothetical protein Emag_000452 [Eimeria magna]
MLQSRSLRWAAGASVFVASAFMGFNYRMSSAPAPVEEPFPTEAERRRVFGEKAESWDREVFVQELLLGIGRWRKQLVREARGQVLEVGAGTGRNFAYYDKRKVTNLTVTDFCRPMINAAMAKKDALQGIPSSFQLANACKLQEADETYDSIVETFGTTYMIIAKKGEAAAEETSKAAG